jgi:hypothetical protein
MKVVCICWLKLWEVYVDVVYWKVLASTNVLEIIILENDYLKLELNPKVLSMLYYRSMRSQENRACNRKFC